MENIFSHESSRRLIASNGLDRFEIDADLPAARDRVQGEPCRVGDIEAELRPIVPRRESGFAAGTVLEFHASRIHRQVAPEDRPEQPPTDDEAVTVSPKGESLRSCSFARAQRLPQTFDAEPSTIRIGTPHVDLIALEGTVSWR